MSNEAAKSTNRSSMHDRGPVRGVGDGSRDLFVGQVRNDQALQDEEVEVDFDEPPRLPVERQGVHDPQACTLGRSNGLRRTRGTARHSSKSAPAVSGIRAWFESVARLTRTKADSLARRPADSTASRRESFSIGTVSARRELADQAVASGAFFSGSSGGEGGHRRSSAPWGSSWSKLSPFQSAHPEFVSPRVSRHSFHEVPLAGKECQRPRRGETARGSA